jgi:hypothetical protein
MLVRQAYAVIVGGRADFVRHSVVSSGVTGFFLFLASILAVECLVELFDNRVILQLSVTRRVGREIDICLILQQWIVPAAK